MKVRMNTMKKKKNQVNQIVVGEEMVGGDKVDRQIIQIFEFYKM